MLFPSFVPFDISISQPSPPPAATPITIHGVRSTTTTNPPLLLLHGFPQTHHIWHRLAALLLPHFTLIAPDLRGYGASSSPAQLTTPSSDHSLFVKSALAVDCIALMDKLGFTDQHFYVLGHDRGGRVAHKLCVDFPARVKKCMLLDIAPTKSVYEATNKLIATAYWHWFFLIQPAPFPEDIILAKPEAFAKKQLLGLVGSNLQKQGPDVSKTNSEDQESKDPTEPSKEELGFFHPEAYAAYVAELKSPSVVHAMCEDYRAGASLDIAEQTADLHAGRHIKCPLRVHWGARGLVEKACDAIAEWKKVSDFGCVDEAGSKKFSAGHYIPEEVPEELARSCMEFFKD